MELFTYSGIDFKIGQRYASDLYNEIKKVYVADNRPWVIGYSGERFNSKLQLVWNALSQLERHHLSKPIYIISSNTRVESPAIIELIKRNLDALQSEAKKQGLPIHAEIVETAITETFWVN
jgi:DNA sulfur modification protein DndC